MLHTITPGFHHALEKIVIAVQNQITAPIVLTTCVMPDRQFVVVNRSLVRKWKMNDAMPLTHSICQHVVAMDYPLVVDDALTHPLVKLNGAVRELGINAYLGAPIRYESDDLRGAICALDTYRRLWTKAEIKTILDAAADINTLTHDPD